MRIAAVVLHESRYSLDLQLLLGDLAAQTRLPDEVLVTAKMWLGVDETPAPAVLQEWLGADTPLRIVVTAGAGDAAVLEAARATDAQMLFVCRSGQRLAPRAVEILAGAAMTTGGHAVCGAHLPEEGGECGLARAPRLMSREALLAERAEPRRRSLVDTLLSSDTEGGGDAGALLEKRSAPARPRTARPRVLLIADTRGWAFERGFLHLREHVTEIDFTIWYITERPMWGGADYARFDLVYVPFHRWPNFTPPFGRAVGGLRSAAFRPASFTTSERFSADDIAYVNRFRRFHTVSRETFDVLAPHCPRLEHLTNPANMAWSGPRTRIRGRCIAAWNGKADREGQPDLKGLRTVIQPACRGAGVPLIVAEHSTTRVPTAEMPDWYRQANVYVCASLYEGASNSVVEAMAAGHALVSTDVGHVRELHDSQMAAFGGSGIVIVERSVDAVRNALAELARDPEQVEHMGRLNRAEIAERWSWDAWRERYLAFYERALEGAAAAA